MRDDIRKDVLQKIRNDYAFGDAKGDWLQKGRCPQCSKKELFTNVTAPWILRCGRSNRCGWEGSVRDLYPEIFDNWSNRHQATETDPNATADAYLAHGRGLDLQFLRGSYSQETYHDRDRNLTTATVRFPLANDSWWERLIDQPGRFDRKARFAWGKSYQGHWWNPPALDLAAMAAADELWIAEGIFDAAALNQAHRCAVSVMSVVNYPAHSLDELRKFIANSDNPTKKPRLIFAFDIGKAGADYTRKFVARARDEGWEATAAQPRAEGEVGKLDWNDLLQRDRLTDADFKNYLWNGRVLIAADPFEKAFLIWQRKPQAGFPVTFNSETFWASFSLSKIDEVVKDLNDNPDWKDRPIEERRQKAAEQAGAIKRICNCDFRTLYFQRNPATDESLYYLRIDFPVERPAVKAGFSGGALAASSEFKKRLLSVAPGAIWTGAAEQLDRLVQMQTRRIKTVETIEFTGYDRERDVYVLGDIAVRKGRVFDLNDEDFFDFGDCALKLATNERLLDIEYDADQVPVDWLPDVLTAFGMNGLITVAFWMLSLFAEQIRAETKSLPFLEMTGLPGTGKSTLIEFLWKVCGRENYEGFDPQKATAAAIARNLGKVSNLPVVLIEGDRNDGAPHSRRFEWEELKSLYNGRATRSRGVKNGGMETFEPAFRGSIIIAQNDIVNATPAVMERIMGLHFDKSNFSIDTKEAAERLEQWPVESLSGFLIHALRKQGEFLETWRAAYRESFVELEKRSGVHNLRLLRNHAQLAAAITAMRCIVPIGDATHRQGLEFVVEMTKARQLIAASEHPTIEKFWSIFDYLVEIEPDGIERPLNNHRKTDELIAVSIPQFMERCRSHGQTPPTEDELRKHLKASKARKFIGQKSVNSPSGKVFQCWVFQRPADEKAVI